MMEWPGRIHNRMLASRVTARHPAIDTISDPIWGWRWHILMILYVKTSLGCRMQRDRASRCVEAPRDIRSVVNEIGHSEMNSEIVLRSIELSWQHLRRSTCSGGKAENRLSSVRDKIAGEDVLILLKHDVSHAENSATGSKTSSKRSTFSKPYHACDVWRTPATA